MTKYMQMQIMQAQKMQSQVLRLHDKIAAVPETSEMSAIESWRSLQQRHFAVHAALEVALQAEHGLTVAEFDVLERLSECCTGDPAGDSKARMQDLAELVNISQSSLSRLVGRMEAERLVERTMCTEDRRGIYTRLTAEGEARYEAARPTQRRVLGEALGA